jgi:hypothetical protein
MVGSECIGLDACERATSEAGCRCPLKNKTKKEGKSDHEKKGHTEKKSGSETKMGQSAFFALNRTRIA